MSFEHYYLQQVGHGLTAFAGVAVQRGHGLGSILSGLFRGALPILKNVGKAVGKQLLKSGLEVASDVVSGVKVILVPRTYGPLFPGNLVLWDNHS